MLLYAGFVLVAFNAIIYGFPLPELTFELAKMFIYAGVLLLLFYGIIRKLDLIFNNYLARNEIGIEQLLPYDYVVFEKIIPESEKIKIAINTYSLDSFWGILKSIIKKKNSFFQILIIGQRETINKYIIDDLNGELKGNVEVRLLEESKIDNVILLSRKTYAMNYSTSYKSMVYISAFDKLSEYSLKNRRLFEELWNDSEMV